MKKAVVIHCDSYKETLRDGFFAAPCYKKLQQVLSDNGIEAHSMDLFDDYKKTDAMIFIDVPHPFEKTLRDMIKAHPGKKIVILWESPVVKPYNYDPAELAAFDYVVTWNDDLVDDKKYFRYRLPLAFGPPEGMIPFKDRKMLTLISGNKMAYHPQELYTERRRAIRFFERHLGKQFDLYGTTWNQRCSFILQYDFNANLRSIRNLIKNPKYFLDYFSHLMPFKSYQGQVENKFTTLAKYRFAVCY